MLPCVSAVTQLWYCIILQQECVDILYFTTAAGIIGQTGLEHQYYKIIVTRYEELASIISRILGLSQYIVFERGIAYALGHSSRTAH